MTSLDRFIARIDDTPLRDILSSELKKRLILLEAELEQIAHDKGHVEAETYGSERIFHLRAIERERAAAKAKVARYQVELESRNL